MRRSLVFLFAATLLTTAGCAQDPKPSASPTAASTPLLTGESTPAAEPSAKPPATKLGYNSVNVDGPYVAITFDDGPHATNTPRLLDMLKQRNIKATFFIVGQCAAEFPAIVKRIADEGHELANHSWSHPNLAKMSDESVRGQLSRTQNAIQQACGITPVLLRPPYGSITDRQRRWITEDMNLKIIMWSLDPLDWKNRNASVVARRILSDAQPGGIILAHDIHATTVAAMPEVFDTLLQRGMKFATVSELLAMEKPATPKPAPASSASPGNAAEGSPSPRPARKAPADRR